ncbi:MAG: hypothetical protein AAB966_01900 [Patescibacteria group bacterium]
MRKYAVKSAVAKRRLRKPAKKPVKRAVRKPARKVARKPRRAARSRSYNLDNFLSYSPYQHGSSTKVGSCTTGCVGGVCGLK